jgi:hypothetical protein
MAVSSYNSRMTSRPTLGQICFCSMVKRNPTKHTIMIRDFHNTLHVYINSNKNEVEVGPRTNYERPKAELKRSSTLSLTSALNGGEWSTPCPGHFTPEK